MWEWRNEPVTREASFNTNYVPYEDHERWFSQKMKDPNARIVIILNPSGREVGYVRFTIVDEKAEISVGVDGVERGRGYGTEAIRRSSDELLATGEVKHILASIKGGNAASIAAFQHAGFTPTAVKEISGVLSHILVYEVGSK